MAHVVGSYVCVVTFFCALAWRDGEPLKRVFHADIVARAPLHVFYLIGVQFELVASRSDTWLWAIGICLGYVVPFAAICCLPIVIRRLRRPLGT